MIETPLYFLDGIQFAIGYERVVHGGRGDYVELKIGQILTPLQCHFKPKDYDNSEPYYYHWLEPEGRTEKIYWQIKTVKYADYKVGYYYISPDLLMPFEEEKPRNVILF